MDIHIIVCFSNSISWDINKAMDLERQRWVLVGSSLITYHPHHFGRNADGERSYIHTLEKEIREKLLNKFCYGPEVFLKIEAV